MIKCFVYLFISISVALKSFAEWMDVLSLLFMVSLFDKLISHIFFRFSVWIFSRVNLATYIRGIEPFERGRPHSIHILNVSRIN